MITSPAAGTVSGVVTIVAEASDAGGVGGVRFQVDGDPLGEEDVAAPYSVEWNSAMAGDGDHALTAAARDLSGNTAASSPVTVSVSNPVATGALAVSVAVTGEGADDNGFTVLVDGSSRGVVPGQGSLVIDELPVGAHTVALGDLFTFCEVVGAAAPAVSITPGATAELTFMVDCVAVPGGRVLYWGALPSGVSQFVAVDPDGADPQVVEVAGFEPDWSPNRQRIAYVGSGDLHLVNADGTGDAALFATASAELAPHWSPDGTRLLYYAPRGGPGTFDVFVTPIAAPNPEPLFASAANRQAPAWSPDGTRIAYSRPAQNGRDAIWVADADGTDEAQITQPDLADASAAWSPDGSRIAFVSGHTEIWAVDIDGSNAVNLTDNGSAEYDPAWSPDGAWIAFVSERTGLPRVWIMRSDGSHAVALSPDQHYQFVGSPSWR
ncbi:MAG TPA: Ig-like domain-containing protein [Gemmatimonadales bacterium]|nr:Ig-like domain-containing protein [Gemmatimonadales bacterium]